MGITGNKAAGHHNDDFVRKILFDPPSSPTQTDGISDEQILSYTTAFIDGSAPKGFSANLYLVASGCFNDERLIDSLELPVEMIKDKPLFFFDPFFGRSTDIDIKVAIAAFINKKLYMIVDKNGERTVDLSGIFTAKDTTTDSSFYACHIYNFLSDN